MDPDTRVVLVGSGKGGVGKSTVTAGLAAALARRGRSVGLLDLDVRAPNLAYVLGEPPVFASDPTGRFHPREIHLTPNGGRPSWLISSQVMAREGRAITMEGADVRQFVEDMVHDVAWPPLDVLTVDLDPSSGDTLIAVAGLFRDVRLVVVAAGDDLSDHDCRRLFDAARRLEIWPVALIGNMIGACCPKCGEMMSYGELPRVRELAESEVVPLVGSLPWAPEFRNEPMRAVTTGHAAAIFDRLADLAEGT